MTTSRRILTTAVLAAAGAAGLMPQAAGAATLQGTVVGRPAVLARSVVVPVLLSTSGERAAGTAVARVVVPRAGSIGTTFTRLKAADLRVGDRVRATVTRIRATSRTRFLTLTRRAATPSFAAMDRRRAAATGGVRQAITATDQLLKDPSGVLDPADPATSNDELRTQLRAVRTDLNLLIDGLRTTADAFDATVAAITAARPTDPARLAVVTRRQAATLTRLTADAGAARTAGKALDDAVANLDETINSVGAPSAPALPVESVTAVSNILYAVLDILRGDDA